MAGVDTEKADFRQGGLLFSSFVFIWRGEGNSWCKNTTCIFLIPFENYIFEQIFASISREHTIIK